MELALQYLAGRQLGQVLGHADAAALEMEQPSLWPQISRTPAPSWLAGRGRGHEAAKAALGCGVDRLVGREHLRCRARARKGTMKASGPSASISNTKTFNITSPTILPAARSTRPGFVGGLLERLVEKRKKSQRSGHIANLALLH